MLQKMSLFVIHKTIMSQVAGECVKYENWQSYSIDFIVLNLSLSWNKIASFIRALCKQADVNKMNGILDQNTK